MGTGSSSGPSTQQTQAPSCRPFRDAFWWCSPHKGTLQSWFQWGTCFHLGLGWRGQTNMSSSQSSQCRDVGKREVNMHFLNYFYCVPCRVVSLVMVQINILYCSIMGCNQILSQKANTLLLLCHCNLLHWPGPAGEPLNLTAATFEHCRHINRRAATMKSLYNQFLCWHQVQWIIWSVK